MRVLESAVASSYSMGKKNKHKLRKSKENEASDSSEEVSGRGCPHVNKSINFNALKKSLGKQVYGECATCAKEVSSKKVDRSLDDLEGATGSDLLDLSEPVLWVCLQCGHQGCGRNSDGKHSLKHFETPRSSQHNIVINTTSWTAWCYDCDDELHPDRHKKLAECMEHLKKIAGVLPIPDQSQGKNGSGGNGGPSCSADAGINKSRPQSNSVCNKVVKGLSNLGNTCFFNAVMQNLIQTYSLENLLGERKKGRAILLIGKEQRSYDGEPFSSSDEGEYDRNSHKLKELPSIEISLSDPGPLTHSLVLFLHEMNYNARSSIINPSALFGQVCKKAPRFKGAQQQDSHELLRYLLDNMKTEEIKRGQVDILKHFKLPENTNPKKVDDEVKTKVKEYGHEVRHTFVECLFGGQLISTVVCEECKFISQILEPFLDLSLPVTEEKLQRPSQAFGGRKKEDGKEEVKDTKAGDGPPAKGEGKMSKHMNRKQKKRAKRESRRQGSKNKVAPVEDDEGREEEADDKDDEENRDGEEGDTKGGEHDKYDASDADVEDNLESDTSRCYLRQANSLNSMMDDSTIVEMTPGQVPLANTITVDAEIVLSNPMSHGPIENAGTEEVSNVGEAVSVSFTVLPNGVIAENAPSDENSTKNTLINTPKTDSDKYNIESVSYTIHPVSADNGHICNTIMQNGFIEDAASANDIDCKFKPVPHCTAENGEPLVNGSIENGVGSSADEEKETCEARPSCSKDSIDSQLTDVTSGVSTISLGPASTDFTVLSSISGLTMNGDAQCVVDNTDSGVGMLENSSHIISSVNKETAGNGVIVKSEQENGIKIENYVGDEITQLVNSHENDIAVASMQDCADVSHVQYSAKDSPHPNAAKHGRSLRDLYREGHRKSINTLVDRYHPSSGECSIESCLHQFTAAELLTGNNKFGCKNCTKLKHKQSPNKEKKELVYSNANKQYLIFQPPAVLTLHLKRFEQVGFSSRKVNRHVEFPFILDIAPYCSSLSQGIKPGQKKILYSLYGVVEHSGRLTSGHYTAYVKVRPNIGTLTNFLNLRHATVREYLHKYAQGVMTGDRLEVEATGDASPDVLAPPGRWYHISDQRVNEVTEASVERAQAYLLFYERIY